MKPKVFFDEAVAKRVETALIGEFGYRFSELVGIPDTDGKKTLVFVLHKFFEFEKRNIGKAYSITWPYVKTVADQLTDKFLEDVNFRERIIRVLRNVGYRNDLKIVA